MGVDAVDSLQCSRHPSIVGECAAVKYPQAQLWGRHIDAANVYVVHEGSYRENAASTSYPRRQRVLQDRDGDWVSLVRGVE